MLLLSFSYFTRPRSHPIFLAVSAFPPPLEPPLRHLQHIFGGDVHVEDPREPAPSEAMTGGIHVRQPNQESAMFWIKMFTENLVQSVEGDLMNLNENTSPGELEDLAERFSAEPKDPLRTTFLSTP